MNTTFAPPSILICGGGFAGALLAIRLLDSAVPLSVIVLEPRETIGRGVAYSTAEPVHLVNGPASHFSLYPEEPAHLERWVRAKGGIGEVAEAFIPRHLFGDYVEAELARAVRDAKGRSTLTHIRQTVTAIGKEVTLANGQRVAADRVVLATGVHPLAPMTDSASPWSSAALDSLRDARDILLIGASLSMVDAVASLERRGYRGRYHVISRRGHLIEPRRIVPERPPFMPQTLPRTAKGLLRIVRQEYRRILAEGGDWQSLPPALRSHVLPLWQGAPDAERRRFDRHLRALWDVMAHRAAPPSFAAVELARDEGRFTARAARLVVARPGEVTLRLRGGPETVLRVDGIIDCRGHQEHDWRRIDTPLVRGLLASGVAVAHPSGFGIRATPDCAVIDRAGRASDRLFALGHPMRGEAWESSSIPEQIAQGGVLAARLLQTLQIGDDGGDLGIAQIQGADQG